MLSLAKQLLVPLLLLVTCGDALTHLHKAPQGDGETPLFRGFAHASSLLSSEVDASEFTKQSDRTMSFAVDLRMDTILWEELEDDSVKMKSCLRDGDTHDIRIEIEGAGLDREDYSRGSAFVIDAEHWTKRCPPVPSLNGINAADPVLFYRINNVTSSASSPGIRLDMTAIPGSQVAPSIRLDVIGTSLKQHTSKRYTFDDSPHFDATARMLQGLPTLPSDQLGAPGGSGSGVFSEFAIFPGANISVSGDIEGSFNNFRILRVFDLEVGWEQTLKADVASRLVATSFYRASNEREIYRRPISDATVSGRIPLFGRYHLNASTTVDLVQEIQADSGVDAYLRATHENLAAVTASYSSRRIKAESLLPPDFASFGDHDINFDRVVEQHVGVNGFYGARPGIAMEARFAGIVVEGTFTATLGLEASMQMRTPAFQPLPYSGRTLGSCDQCHKLQGKASVKGKDLQYHVYENGRLERHKVLDSTLFEKRLTTVCAFTDICPV